MAGRILNRRELRKQTDASEQIAATEVDTPEDAATVVAKPKRASRAKAKTPAVPKVRKARAKKAPPRMRARWCVYDGAMKPIAVFDYNQRGAADDKLAEMLGRKKGTYFLQILKEQMPDADPAEALAVP